ncbi:Unknown protein, partial [Striga hermonthica]
CLCGSSPARPWNDVSKCISPDFNSNVVLFISGKVMQRGWFGSTTSASCLKVRSSFAISAFSMIIWVSFWLLSLPLSSSTSSLSISNWIPLLKIASFSFFYDNFSAFLFIPCLNCWKQRHWDQNLASPNPIVSFQFYYIIVDWVYVLQSDYQKIESKNEVIHSPR